MSRPLAVKGSFTIYIVGHYLLVEAVQQPTKRRPGRPPKPPEGSKRNNLTLRIHEKTRAVIEREAAENGRSLSEEAEARIEQTFREGDLLPRLLELAYGRLPSVVLEMIGRLMRDTGIIADVASLRTPESSGGCLADPFAFAQMREAVDQILEALRPEGEAVVPRPTPTQVIGDPIPPEVANYYAHLGVGLANGLLSAICDSAVTADHIVKIRERLGPEIVKRIKDRGDSPKAGDEAAPSPTRQAAQARRLTGHQWLPSV